MNIRHINKKHKKSNRTAAMDDFNESKVETTEKDNKSTTKSFKIENQCLRHILIAMTICGHYNPNKRKLCSRIFTIYRVLIFLGLLAFAAKSAAGFAYISKHEYFGQAIVLGWNVSSVLTFLFTLRMSHYTFGNQECTFTFLNSIVLPQMVKLGIKFDQVGFKRKQIFLCLVAAVTITLVEVLCVFQLTGVLGVGNTAISTIPFEKTPLTNFILTVLLLVCGIQVNIPTFYMIVICSMLTQCFNGFNQYLDAKMCHETRHVPNNIQAIRQYYTSLCKAVADFDKEFRYLLGNLFFWNISLSLFILFVTLRVNRDNSEIVCVVAYILWLFLCMGSVVVMSVFAALVHEAAHAPLDSIYNINVQGITVEKLAQLNLFMSKLTGTQIGFSTCGLLIITKEFILTIAGVFLTYFAVLYTM